MVRCKSEQAGLSRNDAIKLGSARAPACSVSRPRGTHQGLRWPNHLVCRKMQDRQAGAPAETREGACAPQIEANRSGLAPSAQEITAVPLERDGFFESAMRRQVFADHRGGVHEPGRISIPLISGFSTFGVNVTFNLPSVTSTGTVSM